MYIGSHEGKQYLFLLRQYHVTNSQVNFYFYFCVLNLCFYTIQDAYSTICNVSGFQYAILKYEPFS